MRIADGLNSLLQMTGLVAKLCKIVLDEKEAQVTKELKFNPNYCQAQAYMHVCMHSKCQ
jgi:hypothetical protein